MIGVGISPGMIATRQRRALAVPPTIDADGTFATSTGWTLNDTGGTATVAITGGVCRLTNGSDNLNTWAGAEVTGAAENDVATLQFDFLATSVRQAVFSLGNGVTVGSGTTVGTGRTVQLTCGAESPPKLRIIVGGSSGDPAEIDNVAFV